ncbi:Uncharacterised protein [Segatella copri]|nr:Uncharacterised protein [Segatella copri]
MPPQILTFPLTLWVCRHVHVKPCTHEYVNTYIQKILYYVIENHYIRQS